jgi:hypothetical protein
MKPVGGRQVKQADEDDQQDDRLKITIRLFTRADSRMPMTRTVDISAGHRALQAAAGGLTSGSRARAGAGSSTTR